MTPLPALREDLSLHPGPAAANGTPTWTLHDPIRNRFFRIGWPAFEMLTRWRRGTAQAVAAAVSADTTLRLTPEDAVEMAEFLIANELTQCTSAQDTARMLRRAEARRQSWMLWLLHHYLFFRVPLLRPDRFLEATLHLVGWLGTRRFLIVTLAALLVGLFLVHRQWDVFTSTLVDMFSWSGLAAYLLALAGVKIVHEAAHGYTAKRFGCRVPTMGVAFMVLWPLLYTDVNEAWKLPRRGQRLAVDAAGILAELAVAAWATLAWAFLPEGPARQVAFVLATATWISSLAINLSPFMRFDGYFLLMDALEMPNLHQRAFAIGRWWLRERLFGLGEPQPEPFSRARTRTLVAFAVATWIYRLVLFLGIALLVYHFFIKAVGVALFLVEIVWFVAMPICSEIKVWRERRTAILRNRRSWWTAMVIVTLFLLLLLPWRTQVSAPALLKAAETAEIFIPFPARVERVGVAEGQRVAAGQALFEFSAPDLTHRLVQAEARMRAREYELQAASVDPTFRDRTTVIREELAEALAEGAALHAEVDRLTIAAPIEGIAANLLLGAVPGSWVSPRERLAVLRTPAGAVADGYLSEDDVSRVAVGQAARFFPDAAGRGAVAGRVVTVDRTALKTLPDTLVTVTAGGDLPARLVDGAVVPEGAVYRIRVALDDPIIANQQLRGYLSITGEAQSVLGRLARSVAIVLIREWGA